MPQTPHRYEHVRFEPFGSLWNVIKNSNSESIGQIDFDHELEIECSDKSYIWLTLEEVQEIAHFMEHLTTGETNA